VFGAVEVPELRPLGVGELVDVALKIWRRHLATLARIVVVVVAPATGGPPCLAA